MQIVGETRQRGRKHIHDALCRAGLALRVAEVLGKPHVGIIVSSGAAIDAAAAGLFLPLWKTACRRN